MRVVVAKSRSSKTIPYLMLDAQTQFILAPSYIDLEEAKELSDEISYVQLEKLEDLIRMTSASIKSPPLHHTEIKDGHVYFLPASLALGKAVIYFVKVKERVEEKYVVLDTVHDKISFSNELSTKPTLKHFSIVKVKAQNILPKDIL